LRAPMRGLFNQPYPLNDSRLSRFGTALLFGLFVFVFLGIFKPFELAYLDSGVWSVALGYGLVCTACMVVLNVGVFSLLPNFFSDARWTTGREVCWIALNVFVIGVGNYFYSMSLGIVEADLRGFFLFQAYTVAIGVFPMTISVLLNRRRLERKFKHQSESLTTKIRNYVPNAPGAKPKTVELGKGSEKFDLALADFLYAKSDNNYVEVHYLDAGGENRRVIRETLKNVFDALGHHKGIMKCHKSYVVDLTKVHLISGNAQGYKLHLKGSEETILVSRSLNETVKAYFADNH